MERLCDRGMGRDSMRVGEGRREGEKEGREAKDMILKKQNPGQT